MILCEYNFKALFYIQKEFIDERKLLMKRKALKAAFPHTIPILAGRYCL